MTRRTSLTHRTVTGMLWVAWAKAGRAVLQIGVLAALARVLSPTDFGVVGAALVFINFSTIFAQLGVGPAMVQHPALESRHVRTGFTISLAFGALLGGLTWIGAPLVARFFRLPELTEVLRVLAWIFPIKGLAVVAESLLQRDLQFRWLSNRDLVSYALGYGVVGVVLAFLGLGVWALVAANLAQSVINTALLLIHRPPPFSLGVDRGSLRDLVYFGGGFTVARVANFLALQGDNLVVGRWLGPTALGLYGRAYQLVAMPAGLFGDVLDKVLFPAMAQVQDDPVRLAAAYRRGISLIALVMLPAGAILFIAAPEVVQVVLGPKWSAVTVPLQVFAVGLLFRTSYKMSDSISRATGAVYRRAWRQVVYALLVVGGAWVGQHWGIVGVAIGVLLAVTVNFLLMAQLSLGLGGGTARSLLAAHVPALKLATVTGLVAWALVAALRHAELPPAARLLVAGLAAVACWSFLMWARPAAFLGEEGMWMAQLLRGYLPGRAAAVGSSGGMTG